MCIGTLGTALERVEDRNHRFLTLRKKLLTCLAHLLLLPECQAAGRVHTSISLLSVASQHNSNSSWMCVAAIAFVGGVVGLRVGGIALISDTETPSPFQFCGINWMLHSISKLCHYFSVHVNVCFFYFSDPAGQNRTACTVGEGGGD